VERRRAWRHAERLALTVASDAADGAEIERLLSLGRHELIDVDVAPSHPAREANHFGRISHEPYTTDDGYGIVTSREPGHRHVRHPFETLRTLAADWISQSGAARGDAEDLASALEAHEHFKNDIFVTTNEYLLANRTGSDFWFRQGICSPREALTLVEHFLRVQGHYVVDIGRHGRRVTNRAGFYAPLAQSVLSPVLDALRSCLSPQLNGKREETALYLEAVLRRFTDLLIADDALTALALEEGDRGGGSDLASESLYHLHNELGLFTGSLDTLAWVVASLGCDPLPHRRKISWRALRPKGWGADLTDVSATRIRDAAAAASHAEAIQFVIELRNMYEHRHPIRAAEVKFADQNGSPALTLTLVNVSEAVLGDLPPALNADAGVIRFGDELFAVPHKLSHSMLRWLADTVTEVLSVAAWPDADWWHDPRSPSEVSTSLEGHRQAARFLFGWPR
jgi:hypothetical protein